MRFFLISSFSLFVACGDEKTDTGSDVDSSTETFAPTAGQWSWGSTTYATDDCQLEASFPAETIDATLWDLVLTDDGFSLDNELWTDDPIQCVVTGMNFSCTSIVESIPEAWPEGSENEGAPDATFTTTGTVTGSFDDAETGNVSTVAEITCEGSDCDELGEERGRPTPCTTELSGSFDLE